MVALLFARKKNFAKSRNAFSMIIMSVVGVMMMDAYVPALPQIATYFNCSPAVISYSLSCYIIGFTSSIFFLGPYGHSIIKKKTY